MNEGIKETKERSVFFAILVPVLMLILAEVALLLALLGASGVVDRLSQNDCENMDKQAEIRRDHFQDYLVSMGTDLSALTRQINSTASSLIEQGRLDLNTLDSDSTGSIELLRSSVVSLMATLRTCNSTGVYIVLNTHDLSSHHEKGNYGHKPCIYILDKSSGNEPGVQNEDLVFECAPAEVVDSFSLSKGTGWTEEYDFSSRALSDEYDFLYVPFQSAFETDGPKVALDYAYWSVSPLHEADTKKQCMSYSMPLMLNDGMVYGVVGIDLSADYIESLLPYQELAADENGSYLVGHTDADLASLQVGDSVQVSPFACIGNRVVENTDYGMLFSMVHGVGSQSAYHTVNGQYYISCEPLRLYSENTPFEHDEWVLLGIMPQTALHSFTNQAVNMIGIAVLLMLLLGFLGSIAVGNRLSSPLRLLSKEIAQAELEGSEIIELSRTGITEIDQLTGAISTLSANVASVHRIEQERLEYERDYDLLTGLMNRFAFYSRAEEIFADPDTLKHAAIVMLDLDDLKAINDMYGHDCGDKYIRQAARCFEGSVPRNVLVSRVSGDEFYLLFYGYDMREQIEQDIEKLRQAIPQTEFFLPDGRKTTVSASGGVALYLEDGTEFAELMKLADFTMYQVKEAGKNNIAYFDFETYQRKSFRLRLEREFEDLMGNFELASYHFQPIFDARTGKAFAYEALLRVPLDLLQRPIDVISLAREQGRLAEIERMTWMRSLECYENLWDQGLVSKDAYLFVNSMANLSLDADEMVKIVESHPNVIGNVVIEITEDEDLDEEATNIKRNIPGLPGLFALDDFGSGYNSEVKLLVLRPKFVKIDISIVRNIHQSIDKQRIVSSAVIYAHERDMLIIAEGIESAEEIGTLLDLDVDLLQGYYLAKPAAEPVCINQEAADYLAERLADRPKEGEQA